jgi:hypothetical protein
MTNTSVIMWILFDFYRKLLWFLLSCWWPKIWDFALSAGPDFSLSARSLTLAMFLGSRAGILGSLSVREEFVQRFWFFHSRSACPVFICRRLIFCPGRQGFLTSCPSALDLVSRACARPVLVPLPDCCSQTVFHRFSFLRGLASPVLCWVLILVSSDLLFLPVIQRSQS